MKPNAAKARLASGGRIVNAWCSIASAHTAEALAHQGFDSVTIDLQHGAIDYMAAFHMLQAISTSPATPLARVPGNEPGLLTKLLDSGAYGLICPMINQAAEARAFVSACRYPPDGQRSFGPNRAQYYAGPEYWRHANRETLLFAQIETAEAVDNLEAILATPGLDGIYVGPGDLSLSLGAEPSMAPEDPKVVRAISTILAKTRAKGLFAAVHTDGPVTAKKRFREGFQLCSLQTDMRMLLTAARAAVDAIKDDGPDGHTA